MLNQSQLDYIAGLARDIIRLNFEGVNQKLRDAYSSQYFDKTNPADVNTMVGIITNLAQAGDIASVTKILAVPFPVDQLKQPYRQNARGAQNVLKSQVPEDGGNSNSFDWNALVAGILGVVGIAIGGNQPSPAPNPNQSQPFNWTPVIVIVSLVVGVPLLFLGIAALIKAFKGKGSDK